MKISQQWLHEYVRFKLSPPKFVEELTMLGLEVEGYEDFGKKYEHFVVGRVTECKRHPHADRLTVCAVDAGSAILEIVCGAPNVAAGQYVAVALVGATIPHDQHDPEGRSFVLQRATIRGVVSNGMVCSARELGLGDDTEGILVLDDRSKPGTPLATYFDNTDIVYDIAVTPNRPDCLSHVGIAREVALISRSKVVTPSPRLREAKEFSSKRATVRIRDARRCPRYSARVLTGVSVGPSPSWLQNRLNTIGIRPINNVVDVTNYVLMELGHPLHAFDLERLGGGAVVVRTAKEGERLTTLDGKDRPLTSETLLICDEYKPIALAGIMGGQESEISESTTDILLESAYFDPPTVRRASKRLGLSTEASYRFERGADIGITVLAVNRAAQLIQELTGAEILRGVIDVYPRKRKAVRIRVRVARVNEILGTSLSKKDVVSVLKKLDVPMSSAGDNAVTVTIPSYRVDVLEEIDVIEEIARAYGYQRIETRTRSSVDFATAGNADRAVDEIKDYLVGGGYNEVLTLSLLDANTASRSEGPSIVVQNPVSAEMAHLRTSLIPGMLKVLKHNQNRGQKGVRIFEVGNVFSLNAGVDGSRLDAYREEEKLALLLSGDVTPRTLGGVGRKYDYLDLKGELEGILRKFSLDKHRFIYYDSHSSLTDPTVGVEIHRTYAGYFGKVRSEIAKSFDLKEEAFICELGVDALRNGMLGERKYSQLPRFPGVSRDLAFTVDDQTPQLTVEQVIRDAGGPVLNEVALFDTYAGQQAGFGKKSLAYALEFRSEERTLADEEVDGMVKRIVDAVRQQCGGVLRTM